MSRKIIRKPNPRPELTPEFMAHMSPEFQAVMSAPRGVGVDIEPDHLARALERIGCDPGDGLDDEQIDAFKSLGRGEK